MSSIFTIAQIEQGINYWRNREASGKDAALCQGARVLADVYGLMIFERAETVDAGTLSAASLDALNMALNQRELPL